MRQAALIHDIRQGCSPDLQQKAQGIPIKLRRVDQKNALWLFDVKGSKSAYRVRLKAQVKGNARDINKVDVFASCTCPFWQWQGPEHWAKKNGYLYGRPVGTASRPLDKDPNHQHGACKHVLAVFDWVQRQEWQVPRRKQGSLRYLADILDQGEMRFEYPEAVLRVARRYLHRIGGEDA